MLVPVKESMSGDPISIVPDASALEALDLMVERGIRHLPVVDAQGIVVGVLSIEDLRGALPFAVSRGAGPSPSEREVARDWRVGEIMSHAPLTIGEEDSLASAAERMADHRVGCLPVVDEAGRLLGLLSETDVLRAFATSLWASGVHDRKVGADEAADLVAELRAERERIAMRLEQHRAAEQALSGGAPAPVDEAEAGAELRDLRIAEGLEVLAARRLAAIDEALDRAARGRFGSCERCFAPIPPARLRSLPSTSLCIACARQVEAEPEAG